MMVSILICTLPDRFNYLKRLQNILMPQVLKYSDRVEVRIHDAERHMTTGEKRNLLIQQCWGDYFIFIDDDDIIPDFYLEEIVKAMEQKPDVITFNGYMLTDGESRVDFIIKLGEKYEERNGKYYRFPNHITAMRKSLVENFKFPHITLQEDYQWAKAIHESGVLKTEVHIDKEMYVYDFKSKK